jgi:hypothetical protein
MAEEIQKPTPSQTIAEELERQYSRLLEEKDRRISDKDTQIRTLWRVVSILAAALAACLVGYVIL